MEQRRKMVQRDIKSRGISDRQLLAAMENIPRHLLVGERYRDDALNLVHLFFEYRVTLC